MNVETHDDTHKASQYHTNYSSKMLLAPVYSQLYWYTTTAEQQDKEQDTQKAKQQQIPKERSRTEHRPATAADAPKYWLEKLSVASDCTQAWNK